MKILVPTDFSKSSNNAALYAAKFAKKAKGEIILFHVVHFESPPMAQISGLVEHEIEDIRISNASQDCTLLVSQLKSKVKGLVISFKVIPGYPIENAIENYAVQNKIDLIVMGTKGASGLQKVFGSNAVAVINKSSIPVLTVPEYSRYNNLKHIIYAADMHKLQTEIQKLIPIAQLFDASIHILHVLPDDSNKKIDPINVKNNLIEKYNYKKITFHISHNSDIVAGINEFVADVKADLLVMYTHEITFFEKLFGISFSDNIAFHSLIPLLTLKKYDSNM